MPFFGAVNDAFLLKDYLTCEQKRSIMIAQVRRLRKRSVVTQKLLAAVMLSWSYKGWYGLIIYHIHFPRKETLLYYTLFLNSSYSVMVALTYSLACDLEIPSIDLGRCFC